MNHDHSACENPHHNHVHHVQRDPWDKIGIFLSTACAVHCLLTPFLVLSLPLLAEKFENPWVHIFMALFVVPVGSYAFWSGYRHHGKPMILFIGLAGVSLVGIAAAMSDAMPMFLWGHEGVTIVGSFFLLTAHVLNLRACRCAHEHA